MLHVIRFHFLHSRNFNEKSARKSMVKLWTVLPSRFGRNFWRFKVTYFKIVRLTKRPIQIWLQSYILLYNAYFLKTLIRTNSSLIWNTRNSGSVNLWVYQRLLLRLLIRHFGHCGLLSSVRICNLCTADSYARSLSAFTHTYPHI
jgi:hypothetical protein